MANIKSAAKSARQAVGRRERNLFFKTTMRTKVKAVREAVAASDAAGAQAALKEAVHFVDKTASKGVIHQRTASRTIARLTRAHAFSRPIVTEVQRLPGFYPAETYHQDYLLHHPDQPYIAINDLPKVRALRRDFPELWRDRPSPWKMDAASSSH
ncbi:MAG: 30S ribosomal protein S20 [Candidatus Palauibacterales bacterium]|nr:30S ribosomal protein S20 [Candidatus Palauibacterales bacterium]